MVKYKRILILAASLLLYSTSDLGAAPTDVYEQSQTTTILGKKTGASLTAGVPEGTRILQSSATTKILGILFHAFQAYVGAPNTYNGTTYTEFYSFGKRIFSEAGNLSTGVNSVSVSLAPVEVRIPFFIYPIGPLLLELDGGVRFQASLAADVTAEVAIPIELASIGANLQARADGAGFIEGYGKLLVVRAGVGGQLTLIDARANVNSRFTFDGLPPIVGVSAMVEFLKGRFYAYFDYFRIFPFGWRRLWDQEIFSWNGFCYATGSVSCPGS